MKKSYLSQVTVKSAVQIVVDQLTQGIIDGQLKPGDRIPTETELAESFGVGRNTVREAVRTLVAYGVLEIRRPDGTFVCDSFQPQGINPMLYSLILQKDNSYVELIGLREVIETGTMLLLMEKGLAQEEKDNLLKRAQDIERAVSARPVSIENITQADFAFHDALAKATGNRLIVLMNDMVSKLSYGSRVKTIEERMKQGNGKYLIDTHYDLLEKVTGNDMAAMCTALKDSYYYWKDINKYWTDSPNSAKPEDPAEAT